MRVLLASVLGRLAAPTAVLVGGMLFGSPAPVTADSSGVLNACVHTDRHGDLRGVLRIVGDHERCSRREAHVTLRSDAGHSSGSGADSRRGRHQGHPEGVRSKPDTRT